MPPSEPLEAQAPAQGEAGWRIDITFVPDILRRGTNPLALLDDLRDLGPCTVEARLDALPDFAALDPEALAIGWIVTLRGPVTREAIEDVFLFVQDEVALTFTPLGDVLEAPVPGVAAVTPQQGQPVAPQIEAPAPPAAAATEPRGSARRSEERTASTVRVEAGRLDELMDRVGELVIAQARLSQLAGLHADGGIKTISEEIERLSARLRDTTMSIRMVPSAPCSAASGASSTTCRAISASRWISSRRVRRPSSTRP